MEPWIQTFTGKSFWFYDPKPEQICLLDIAHALSNVCRFGGHSKFHYSVAQHSVIVSRIAEKIAADECPKWFVAANIHGLIHDAAEAYIGDIVKPLKHSLDGIAEELEESTHLAICRYLELSPTIDKQVSDIIKRADNIALAMEARDLMNTPDIGSWKLRENPLPEKIVPVSPEKARELFIRRFFSSQMTDQVLLKEATTLSYCNLTPKEWSDVGDRIKQAQRVKDLTNKEA